MPARAGFRIPAITDQDSGMISQSLVHTSVQRCWQSGTVRLLIMSSPKWLRRPWRWPLQILLLPIFITASGAQSNSSSHSCYFPSGIISAGKPCHSNAKNSVCCGPGFQCLSNKVCQTTPAIDNTFKYSLYRSGCTDPTFQDPACPRFCFRGKRVMVLGAWVSS